MSYTQVGYVRGRDVTLNLFLMTEDRGQEMPQSERILGIIKVRLVAFTISSSELN